MAPTSATGTRARAAEAAFTLVEVLVVVALVGILLAVAAVNLMPNDAETARREATRLALDIEHARDSAWFGGLPTSMTLAEGRSRLWKLRGREWARDASRDRAMDPALRIVSVHVDGQLLPPGDRLLFLSDGLGTPFRVALELRGHAWAIEGDAAGAIRRVPQ